MILYFGLELDEHHLPRPDRSGGAHVCGRKTLLSLLENCLGLDGWPDDIDYLRIEQYRQAVIAHLATGDGQRSFFYQKSFEADPFATAAELLSRRDELLLAGWDFELQGNMPPRLAALAELEAIFQNNALPRPVPGYADRFVEVLKTLDFREHPFSEIWLNEPLELLPCHFRRLFDKMSSTAARPGVQQMVGAAALPNTSAPQTDLQKFQRRLSGNGPAEKHDPTNDGSLLLLRAKRAVDAAWLAQLFRLNRPAGEQKADAGPALLVPEKNRMLDMALVQEGLPSLGIESASLARPVLQILKLAPTFLWEPVDPFKVLEFVSLSIKPLADDLATRIANQVAQSPGLQGEGWRGMIQRYFAELEEKAAEDPTVRPGEVRRQYHFWFERRRYDMSRTVPKDDVMEVFSFLKEWAWTSFDEHGGKNTSLLVLAEQAKRIVELLAALPETELTHLELERIVRTIYEPSPVVFQVRETGHLPYVSHPGAFTGPVSEVWWWNFIQNEPPHFFSRWYGNERDYLALLNVRPDTPEQENALMRWQQVRPVLLARERLVLVLPDTVDGEEVLPHPLFGDLQAAFSGLDTIAQHLGTVAAAGKGPFSRHFALPGIEKIETRNLGRPKPFLLVRNLDKLQREHETLTSLESLFYYPYQWVFRHKIKLNKSSILSVVPDHTLKGNLAHRIFEKLLKEEDPYRLDQPALSQWIDHETRRLLAREGAVLLMYGKEPDRIHFLNKLKYAAWCLVSHIRDNGWKVVGTEVELAGTFPTESGSPAVRGIADLLLERDGELAVVDLKWRGSARRAEMLRNEEDLQLVLYARLATPPGTWAHTAYFIIENGKLLVRNNRAFANLPPLAPDRDHREVNESILRKMTATWHWRMEQLAAGQIEIRCRQTLTDIEESYASDGMGHAMFDLLEMKNNDAPWDDYRTLINLVE